MIQDMVWKLKITINKFVIFLMIQALVCNSLVYTCIVNDYDNVVFSICMMLWALIQLIDNRKDRQTLGVVLTTGCVTTLLSIYFIINSDNPVLGVIYIIELVLIIVFSQITKSKLYPEDKLS